MEPASVIAICAASVFFAVTIHTAVSMERYARKLKREAKEMEIQIEQDAREERLKREIQALELSLGNKIDELDRKIERLEAKTPLVSSARI